MRPPNQLVFWTRGSASGNSFFWSFNEQALFFEPQTLPEVFRVPVGITSHQPGMPVVLAFLLHPSQRLILRCPSYVPKVDGKNQHTFSDLRFFFHSQG